MEENFQKEYNSSICTLIFSKQEQKNNNPTLCIEKKVISRQDPLKILIISKLFHRIKNRALKEKSHTSSCRINLKIVQSKTVREQFLRKKGSEIKNCFSYEKSFCISTVLRGQLYRTSHKLEFLTNLPTLAAIAYSNLTETGEISSLNKVKMLSWSAKRRYFKGKMWINK